MIKSILFTLAFSLLFLHSPGQNFEWIKQGSGVNYGHSSVKIMCTDSAGYIYAAGDFYDSLNFDDAQIIAEHSNSGSHKHDNFILKINQSGAIVWAIRQGQEIKGMALDHKGNLYVTGIFSGIITFGSGANSDSLQSQDSWDGFIARYDTNGTYIWAIQAKGLGYQGLDDIATDSQGNIYVAGDYSQEINIDGSILLGDHYPQNNGVLAQLDSNANLNWIQEFKAKTNASVDYLKLYITDDKIFVTGSVSGTLLFGTIPDTVSIQSYKTPWNANSWDAFIARYDNSGHLIWVQKAGGVMTESVWDIVSDDESIYLTGRYDTTALFGNGIHTSYLHGFNTYYSSVDRTYNRENVFIAKYKHNGELSWVKDIKRIRGNLYCRGITLDGNKDILICGVFNDSISVDNSLFTRTGVDDTYNIFISKFDNNGNVKWLVNTHSYTNVYSDPGAMDIIFAVESYYISGLFAGKTSFGSLTVTSDYWQDAFIAKVSNEGFIGVDNQSVFSNELLIFPNPISEVLNIVFWSSSTFNNISFKINNIIGQTLYTSSMSNFKGEYHHAMRLDLENKGIYFIEIIADDKRIVKKVIFQ